MRSKLIELLRICRVKWRGVILFVQTQLARLHHRKQERRIRAKLLRKEPLRVLFLDSEVAKWKAQSLFSAMAASPLFDPVVGISIRDSQLLGEHDRRAIKDAMQQARDYYLKHGCKCVDVFDAESDRFIDLKAYEPDIVFYQQSWYDYDCHHAREVSKFAVTCYIPYYVANYGDLKIDSQLPNHRFFNYYFLLNEGWSDIFRKGSPRWFHSGKFVPTGHTMLDQLREEHAKYSGRPMIIYAPHWTFVHPRHKTALHYSNFLENGMEILRYAESHPEFDWVFKPHPTLFRHLTELSIWERPQVEDYIKRWKRLGSYCTDGDYMPLFAKASAMITDCASFLTEFGATGKPIIHLICAANHIKPMRPSAELYGTYYQVHDNSEMIETFDRVLVRGDDFLKTVRLAAVKRANLAGTCATDNIISFIVNKIGVSMS